MTLRGDHLTLRHGSLCVLDDVFLELKPGCFTAVLGPNGAGKSTLLRLLTGEWQPSAGEVLLEGKPLWTWHPCLRARRMAVLPQRSSMWLPFPVFDVVRMGRAPHERLSREAHSLRIVWQCLEAMGVTHLAERRFTELSGGEQQRVQLARVLAQVWEPADYPHYLMLDEPTSSLDLAHQYELLDVARSFARRGGAVLAVLHDLNLAAAYADHIALLDGGRMLVVGPPEDVLTVAWIEEVYRVRARLGTHPFHDGPLVVTASAEEDECRSLKKGTKQSLQRSSAP